ncbi:MAG: hypothetical protein ABIH37_00880 [archaeon]
MEIEEILMQLFCIRMDCYAVQQEKGYLAVKEPVTLELIKKHLLGLITIGLYQLLGEMIKWGCFDFDKNTIEDFEHAKRLFKYLKELGYHPLMEMSGGGEYKCHIWIFADTAAELMEEFLDDICAKTEIYPHEVFPKQIKVVEGGFGNLVKLPLGVHMKTKQRSYFLDDNFNEIKSMEAAAKRLQEYLD